MRFRLLFVPLALVLSLSLMVAACGGDSGSDGADVPADDVSISGLVAPDTFLAFEGQIYRLQDALQAAFVNEGFTKIGVATEADIDFEGDLEVFRREGDDAAVYTFSAAVTEEGEEEPTPGLWLRWELEP